MEAVSNEDIETLMKEGGFVSGGRGSGKSTLGFWITVKLRSLGMKVRVIDSSLVWRKKSNLEFFQTLNHRYDTVQDIDNIIYDLSRLSTIHMREVTSDLLRRELNKAIRETEQDTFNPTCFILEECQNLIPSSSLWSNDFQEKSRYLTQSRNFARSFLAITQRPASCDTNLIELAGLRFWGRKSGENNLRKAKAYLGKETARKLQSLQIGQFVKQVGEDISLIQNQRFPQF